jgi:hypothetical protein
MRAGVEKRDVDPVLEQSAHRRGDAGIGMKHRVDLRDLLRRELDQRGGDPLQSLAPAFAAVARYQQMRQMTAAQRRRRQLLFDPDKGVDSRIAGQRDVAPHTFGDQVLHRRWRRGEQQVGPGIDGNAIVFLGPGKKRIVRPQARLDMGHGNSGIERRQGAPERARCVALDDDEVRSAKLWRQPPAHVSDVSVRMRPSGAVELGVLIALESEVRRIERLLAGECERRRKPALRERVRNGQEFDGFRPGSDDQSDIGETQPSP